VKQRGGDVRYHTELVSFTQDSQGVTATIRDRTTGTSSVLHADYLAACDGAHSRIREALGVKAEGLGVLDEYYLFVYFRAEWRDLIRGYEADAILIDRPGIQGFFLITDADRGMFLIQYAPSRGEAARNHVPSGGSEPPRQTSVLRPSAWAARQNRAWPGAV
jgi:putative polyketide hydroxylase